jgi:hypothetical protein
MRKRPVKREAKQQRALKQQFLDAFRKTPDFAHELGLNPDQSFDVEELRNAMRLVPTAKAFLKS